MSIYFITYVSYVTDVKLLIVEIKTKNLEKQIIVQSYKFYFKVQI